MASVILGDFNEDILHDQNNVLLSLMLSFVIIHWLHTCNSVGTGPFTNKSIVTLCVMQPFTSSPTNNPAVSTTPNNDSGRNSSSTTGGAVAGVVVSLLLIIGATLGIIALLWIWRRYTYTHTVHYNTY